jgi:hypothetical protein
MEFLTLLISKRSENHEKNRRKSTSSRTVVVSITIIHLLVPLPSSYDAGKKTKIN